MIDPEKSTHSAQQTFVPSSSQHQSTAAHDTAIRKRRTRGVDGSNFDGEESPLRRNQRRGVYAPLSPIFDPPL